MDLVSRNRMASSDSVCWHFLISERRPFLESQGHDTRTICVSCSLSYFYPQNHPAGHLFRTVIVGALLFSRNHQAPFINTRATLLVAASMPYRHSPSMSPRQFYS